MPEPIPVDVMLVSPGTTAGWRRADQEMAELLREHGVTTAIAATDFRVARHLRRGVLLTDLAEAAAMRRALAVALRRNRPRAILYSSPQATMLQPRRRLGGATAVRFDEPAATNRAGPGTALLRLLERQALRRVRLLLPIGTEPSEEARAVGVDTPMIALPISVEVDAAPQVHREQIALTYAANPDKKGLDLAVAAWRLAAPAGWRLVVTGIDAEAGRRFLARRGVAEPSGVEWPGLVPSERYRELVRRAAMLVSASRHEDYGLAQLEALGAGALLATLPASGPYPALDLARSLDDRLVAEEVSAPSLANALGPAFAMSDSERAAYAGRARVLLRPHSREELARRLTQQVLPVLLPESSPSS